MRAGERLHPRAAARSGFVVGARITAAGGRLTDAKTQAREELRGHWTLIMAAAIGFAFSSVVAASTGVFMEPMGKEFGWSRTLLSSALSISAVGTALFSPLFGVLIDRWGTRRMALAGTVLAGLMISWLSQLSGSAVEWIGFWILYTVAGLMIKSTVWTAAVSSVFTAGRGLALGLTLRALRWRRRSFRRSPIS